MAESKNSIVERVVYYITVTKEYRIGFWNWKWSAWRR